ncbi:GTP cyclohydrolase I FolE2 [Thauera sp. WH-1]|uniref:GTP cyclohydrolase I FolE2 n=1 Tax=Thauera sp. WH-1 TaxID=3398230 RepID=UPI0039FDBE1C
MNAPENFFLPDVQSSADHRALAIQRVGVRGLRYPMSIRDTDGSVQHTVATLEMTVGLPADVKGTHMSRFVELLEAEREALDLDLRELVRMAEEEASCEVFGLLKRPDEKWVTERAYDNPKFVEDLVRDIALRLRADARIAAWSVQSENFESIHNHSAYALIEGENAAE